MTEDQKVTEDMQELFRLIVALALFDDSKLDAIFSQINEFESFGWMLAQPQLASAEFELGNKIKPLLSLVRKLKTDHGESIMLLIQQGFHLSKEDQEAISEI